jgi:hypothetical protein
VSRGRRDDLRAAAVQLAVDGRVTTRGALGFVLGPHRFLYRLAAFLPARQCGVMGRPLRPTAITTEPQLVGTGPTSSPAAEAAASA